MKVTFQKSLLLFAVLALTTVRHLQASTIDWQLCYAKADGTVFSIANDCTSYIYCLEQTPVTLPCPTNMGFSVAARGCVNKIDSDCVVQSNNETTSNAASKSNANFLTTTVSSRETTLATCDNERRPENQVACAGQNFGALVPYPGNCSQFLVCNCEYPTVRVCPGGLWFDNTIKVCNFPQAVDCDNSVGTTTPIVLTTTEEPTTTTTTESNDWGTNCIAPEGMSADICLKYDNGFLLRYPYNCNAYVNCTMGCPVMNYCQADKVFNSFLKICDTPDTAQCEELPMPETTTTTEEPKTTTEEPTTTTTEEPTTTTEEPTTTTTEEPTTTTEEPTTTTTEEPITPPGECIPTPGIDISLCAGQAQGSFVPYPYDCTAYIVCKWECPYLEYCENDNIFNALLGICDTPDGIICDKIPLPTTTTTVAGESTTTTESTPPTNPTLPPDVNPDLCLYQQDNTIYPYEGDCSQYLQCVDGEVIVQSCPNGWIFNSQLMICDIASEDVCYTGTTTTEATITTTEATTPKAPGFDLCVGQPENTTFPYTEDCSWYYFCLGNDLYYLLPCPYNNYYDPYSGKCGPSESPTACKEPITTTTTVATTLSPGEKCADQGAGTTFPYEANCQQYIFCNGRGGYSIINCPLNNYYFPDSGNCGPSADPYICLSGSTTTVATTTTTITTTTELTTTTQTTTTTTTPKPSLGICGDLSNGELIEYPDNCQKYISCVLPIPIGFYCNNNWYFDVDQQQCVPDTYGTCSDLPSNSTTVQPPYEICQGLSEGDWQIYPTNCKLYYQCLGDGYYMLQICSEGEYFNPLLGQCSSEVGSEYCKQNFDTTTTTSTTTAAPPKPTGICAQQPEGGKIAYPHNCFKYIVCESPIPVGHHCPADLQFSFEQQGCVEAQDSDCGSKTTTTTTPEVPTSTIAYSLCTDKPNFTILPYEPDCSMFIVCIDESEHLAYCNQNQYFDVLQGICLAEANEDSCRGQETTTTDGSSTTTTESWPTTEETTTTNEAGITTTEVSTTTTEESTTTTEESTTTTTEDSTTTTQDPNLGPCYNKPDGTKLPYPNNCEKYIECRDPLPVGYDCPAGLEFSATLRECVAPELADCSIQTTTPSITTTETETVTPTSPSTTTTPNTEETCENKPNGSTLPYPADCSRFYICLNGQPRLTNCMPNTFYDPSTGMCGSDISPTACQATSVTTTTNEPTTTTISTEPTTTDASTESTTTIITTSDATTTTPQEPEAPCSGQSNGYTYSDENDCSRYYMCMNGSPILVKCTANAYFNPSTGKCDDETSSTACKETEATTTTTEDTNTTLEMTTTTTEATTTETTTTNNPQSDNICCGQKSGTKLPYPGNSNQYVICQYPVPLVEQCPQNGNYDATTGSCQTAQPNCSQLNYGTVMTYEGDCTKYYFCFGSNAMVLHCSNDWYFSPILKQCVPKSIYSCPW